MMQTTLSYGRQCYCVKEMNILKFAMLLINRLCQRTESKKKYVVVTQITKVHPIIITQL